MSSAVREMSMIVSPVNRDLLVRQLAEELVVQGRVDAGPLDGLEDRH